MRRLRAFLVSLLSLHGSPRGIGGGFALGLGLSLVPIPFAGMVVALALVPIARVNPAATYLGTAVVNPVTGPFLYFFELWLGMRLLGRAAPEWAALRELDGAGWLDLFWGLLGPFALGAAVTAPVAAALAGAGAVLLVRRWRRGANDEDAPEAPKSQDNSV
ncbi:MAG: DUF2062 domain-containing protein [Nannocystaceae bacterium]